MQQGVPRLCAEGASLVVPEDCPDALGVAGLPSRGPAVSMAQSPTVLVMKVDDTITPVVADHVEEGLRTAGGLR